MTLLETSPHVHQLLQLHSTCL